MTQANKSIVTAFAALVLLTSLSACKKPEGPAETLGKDIDQATQKAGQQIEKTGEEIKDAGKK